jgi:hypothetical protein
MALDALVSALLEEVERSGHKHELFITFTACLVPLLRRLGLYTVKHLPRLMPLLLQQQLTLSGSTRVAAVLLLAEVVIRTWPRMPAHALIIFQVLASAAQQEDDLYFKGGETRGAEAAAAEQLLRKWTGQQEKENETQVAFEHVPGEWLASCTAHKSSSHTKAGTWIAAASRVVSLLCLCAADALKTAAPAAIKGPLRNGKGKSTTNEGVQGPCMQCLLAALNLSS